MKEETYFSFIAPFQQRDNPFLDFIVPKRIALSALWLYRRLIIQMMSCYVLTSVSRCNVYKLNNSVNLACNIFLISAGEFRLRDFDFLEMFRIAR